MIYIAFFSLGREGKKGSRLIKNQDKTGDFSGIQNKVWHVPISKSSAFIDTGYYGGGVRRVRLLISAAGAEVIRGRSTGSAVRKTGPSAINFHCCAGRHRPRPPQIRVLIVRLLECVRDSVLWGAQERVDKCQLVVCCEPEQSPAVAVEVVTPIRAQDLGFRPRYPSTRPSVRVHYHHQLTPTAYVPNGCV